MQSSSNKQDAEAGLSLVELLLSLMIALALLGMASDLLTRSYAVRQREDRKVDAVADVQRTLNIVSRELANSGFGLNDNGLVAADCAASSIRMRANLNAFDRQVTSNTTSDENEDIKYLMYVEDSEQRRYLVRYDVNTRKTTVLANRIDQFEVHYFASRVSYTTDGCTIQVTTPGAVEASPDAATYVVLVACVQLPASGEPGSSGYQPASTVTLASDVVLRNADLARY